MGDFTIASYNHDDQYYTLQCKCGATAVGDSGFITRKIANLLTDGFTACMDCYYKHRANLKIKQTQNATYYVFKDVYREYVKKSKERNIEFALSLEECEPLFLGNCDYCGNPPKNKRTRDTGITVQYQGIDRVDNSIGYLPGNVVPCCKYCNSFKLDRNREDFLLHVETIYNKNVQRPERKLVDSSESKWEASTNMEEDMV